MLKIMLCIMETLFGEHTVFAIYAAVCVIFTAENILKIVVLGDMYEYSE